MMAKDKITIDSIIETANQLHRIIQLNDADEGVIGNTGLNRSKSAPSRMLPDSGNIHKLHNALRQLRRSLKHMRSLQSDVENEMKEHLHQLTPVDEGVQSSEELRKILDDWTKRDLEDITKKLLALKRKIPEKRKKKKAAPDYPEGDGDDNSTRLLCLPAIHANEEDLKRLAVFRQVKDKYKNLSTDRQICLLSFSVFPENREVNRTMLMYWWIGEGFLPDGDQPEFYVKKILRQFTDENLIEPVKDERKMEPSSYKMAPFVHSSVVLISKKIGLFDIYHEGGKPTMKQSKLNKVCLVEGSSSQKEARGRIEDADHIETVFNVSEGFPDFTSKWFSSMKKLRVLYLGRWERTKHEIKVDSRRVMKNLSSMRELRFLSFQGISTIKSLSRSVCKLKKLIVLDLRDCDYLEKLPEDIQKLKHLVYLDLTGCEALESIPVGAAWLPNLEVLKGFVVSDDREIACKLEKLKQLSKLRKLSVTVDREDFGLHNLIEAIKEFAKLEKLKVQRGNRIPQSMNLDLKEAGLEVAGHCLPSTLRKLDLQRFPDSKLPNWLQPQNLINLDKLYLGSWRRLEGFGNLPGQRTDCSVRVLRLTCLPKLKAEWRELTPFYFPKLKFLEMNECPKVTFSPCDGNGIWRSDER